MDSSVAADTSGKDDYSGRSFASEVVTVATVVRHKAIRSKTTIIIMSRPREMHPTVRQYIIINVEAPQLRDVSTKNFVEFKRLTEQYEKQVQEKSQEPNTIIVPIASKASSDDGNLRILIVVGWISAPSIQDITEEEIVQCVKQHCQNGEKGEYMYLINLAIAKVGMETPIVEAQE